jgi:hypothetical protein
VEQIVEGFEAAGEEEQDARESVQGEVMKYIAKPVVVNAYRIADAKELPDGRTVCRLEATLDTAIDTSDPAIACATPAMTARMKPKAGDYWVVQSDGYEYLNPKEVFERKYSPAVCGSDGKWYSVNDKDIPG